jgi:hypothetical protein
MDYLCGSNATKKPNYRRKPQYSVNFTHKSYMKVIVLLLKGKPIPLQVWTDP